MGFFIGIMGIAFVLVTLYIVNDSPAITIINQENQENQGEALTTKQVLNNLYKNYGNRYGIDPYLLKAIAQIESSENPYALNKSSHCYGLMQILCQPDNQGGCRNKLNVDGWPPLFIDRLYSPSYNVRIGTQILKWNINTYGLKKGIAVYNSWSARHDAKNGPFRNQGYVNKVMGKYHDLQKSGIFT